MPSKPLTISTLLILSLAATTAMSAAGDLSTLFTTPQERQLINSNRYKSDEVRPEPVEDDPVESPYQILTQEEVSFEYRISGISLSAEGAHTVWINDMAYQDDARLEDGSRVKVISGQDVRVRITAPDGKQYFATSGETLEVTYMATIEN